MRRLEAGSALALVVLAFACVLAAEPALAQVAAPPQRLNWFWSIFAGFVLAGFAIAILAWLFEISKLHWIFVLVLWAVATYILRFHTRI